MASVRRLKLAAMLPIATDSQTAGPMGLLRSLDEARNVTFSGLPKMPTRRGGPPRSSVRRSSRLPQRGCGLCMKPVMFPPGLYGAMTAIAGHANSAPDVDQRTEQRRKHRFIVIRDEQIVRGRNGGVQCLLLPEGKAKRSLNRRHE